MDIDIYDAIALMKERTEACVYFSITFFTYDSKRKISNGLRSIQKASIRSNPPKNIYQYDSDLYLCITDIDAKEDKLIHKFLIRELVIDNQTYNVKVK